MIEGAWQSELGRPVRWSRVEGSPLWSKERYAAEPAEAEGDEADHAHAECEERPQPHALVLVAALRELQQLVERVPVPVDEDGELGLDAVHRLRLLHGERIVLEVGGVEHAEAAPGLRIREISAAEIRGGCG